MLFFVVVVSSTPCALPFQSATSDKRLGLGARGGGGGQWAAEGGGGGQWAAERGGGGGQWGADGGEGGTIGGVG